MLANLNRRNALKILAGLGVSGIGITSLHAYDKNQRTLHDLTVIGQGQSVVVQIHDPSCPTCRRLKSAVTTAMKATPDIHFRLADITTAEGKALQNKYGVPHVTLLFFDGNGTHRHTTRGLLSAEQVRNNIDRYLS
ncbi:MAG: thioredoxin family protein [Pseudomonadota bacterium]